MQLDSRDLMTFFGYLECQEAMTDMKGERMPIFESKVHSPQLAQTSFLAHAKDFGSASNFLQKMQEPRQSG
eukprot:s1605_g19.t1